jgi:hypothetical protein
MEIKDEEIINYMKKNSLIVIQEKLKNLTLKEIEEFTVFDYDGDGFVDGYKNLARFKCAMYFNVIPPDEAKERILVERMHKNL